MGCNKVKLVVFDVNGTLLDDTTSFLNAINGIFARYGKQPLPIPILKERFGQPWTKIYREEGISEQIASDKELYEIYNELYRAEPSPQPFAGLNEGLEWLLNQKVQIAIVSTQQNSITVPLLQLYGLSRFFSIIKGGVADKSQALGQVFEHFGIRPDEAAYVGDQEGDAFHAKQAGCISIGFCGGLHSKERLQKAGADFLICSHSELKGLPIFNDANINA